MKIFLTGASGYIGSAVARCLVKAGHEVTGLTHSPEKIPRLRDLGVMPVLGDMRKPATYRPEADSCEVLIHTAFDYGARGPEADRAALDGLIATARSAKAPRLLVYTSGVWVLGPRKGGPADESAQPKPIAPVRWRPLHEDLALDAAQGRVAAVVVRPGCVYGEKGGLYGMMFSSAHDDRTVRVIDGGRNCWAAVYLDDLAEFYRLVAERRPHKAIYHVTDGCAEPLRDVAEAVLDAAGGGEVEDLTLEAARKVMGPLADGWALDQLVSNERALKLGWRPTLESAAGNAMTLLTQWKEQLGPASVA